ncbi:MAG: hypothetical protein AAF847_07545 [Bacteroidota bacterium]
MLKSRHVLLSLFFLLSYHHSFSQDQYDYTSGSLDQFRSKGSATLNNELKYAFRIDAARLSIRTDQDLRSQSVRIPEVEIERYYRLLTAVYKANDLARSIIACGVHTAAQTSVDYAELIYDRRSPWAAPLQSGIARTESPAINRLMEEYDLIIQSHRQIDQQRDILIIRAAEPINMAALTNTLYEVEGILKVNLRANPQMTSDIQVRPVDRGWNISFVRYFEEDGARQQHTWVYHVSESWEVEFLNELGAPLPEALACP